MRGLKTATAAAALIVGALPAGASMMLLTPLAFDFGDVHTGAVSAPQVVRAINTGSTAVTPSFAGGAVASAGFFAVQNCAGRTFAPGESCEFTYTFAPEVQGAATGTTTIGVDGVQTSFEFVGNGISAFNASARSFDFGGVAVGGASAAQSVTITNVSNAPQTPSFAGGAVAGGDFDAVQNCAGRTFAPGESCAFTYTFTPQAAGQITGSTTFAIDDEQIELTFSGTGDGTSPFLVSPRDFDFGDMHVGATSPSQAVRITNVSAASLTPSFAGGAVANPAFTAVQNCAGRTFAPGAFCEFTYAFAPGAEGPATGTTTIGIDGTNYAFAFAGNGLDAFLVSPLSLAFGEIAVGATSPVQGVSITNVSGVAQTPSFAGGAVAGGIFDAVQNCAGRTFAPGESCMFSYLFKPLAEGVQTGTTSIGIDGKLRTITMTGTGVGEAPPPLTPVPLPASLYLLGGPVALALLLRRRPRRA